MNISPISYTAASTRFGNASGSFQDIINKPQAYTIKPETPAASTNISGKEGKKNSPAKIIGGIVVAAGAIATGLALLATKTNVLIPTEGGNAILNKAKGHLATAGHIIADSAASAKEWIINKLPQKAAEIGK